ncbi:hypothetical protein [Candidatus Korobacter versatilis]|uniref:hypothetical protein n=1 Tax=Candidatus Korobacter versatilis TaxID=658062 RepID=UPI001E3509C4|nr:hypothetical protein [Candidatus Koribacter versatilis]
MNPLLPVGPDPWVTFHDAYSPGHNSFFQTDNGKQDWILYHANSGPTKVAPISDLRARSPSPGIPTAHPTSAHPPA